MHSRRRRSRSRAPQRFPAVRCHYAAIIAAGGVILIAMGVLVDTNELFRLNIEAQKLLDRVRPNFFDDV